MADLIKRSDAIDVVKGIDSYFVRYIEELPSAQPDHFRDSTKKIESEQQWIPCSVRLPEKYGAYIVTDIDRDVEIAQFEEDWDWCGDKNRQAWWVEELGWTEVLAWMPLPEPWKGEP